MTWLTIQSLPTIMLALALGLVLGWLIWARRWERTRTTRREVLGHLVYAHQRELADRDSQLEILREQLDEERRENAATLEAQRRKLPQGRAAPVNAVATADTADTHAAGDTQAPGDTNDATAIRVPSRFVMGPRDG